jgi:LPXTG-site transpeptidase (sortase) family protein
VTLARYLFHRFQAFFSSQHRRSNPRRDSRPFPIQRHRSTLRVLIVSCSVIVLSACQSAPPPRPAAAVPTYPVVSPPGVPPVIGRGTLAIVPAGPGETVPVAADLGEGWLATVYVRSQPTVPIIVRLQVLPSSELPHPSGPNAGLVTSLEFFDPASGSLLASPPEATSIAVRPPEGSDVSQLAILQRPATSRDFETLSTTADTSARAIGARLRSSSSLVLAVVPASPAIVSAPTQEVLTSALGNRAPLPQRLKIPTIGVDASITPLGLDPSGIMASPTEGHVVGWYELGPRPGEASNAVLAGHVDWAKQMAVFFNLSKLKPGEVIEVQSGQDRHYRYEVEDVRLYTLEDAPLREIFGATPVPTLTLITCGGAFDQDRHEYLERVVVRAHGV